MDEIRIIGVETLSDELGRASATTRFEIVASRRQPPAAPARNLRPRRRRRRAAARSGARQRCSDPAIPAARRTSTAAPATSIEACAGLLDGDDPEACARKEAEEETGYRVTSIRPLFAAYMSPGSVTEKLHCFIAGYDADCADFRRRRPRSMRARISKCLKCRSPGAGHGRLGRDRRRQDHHGAAASGAREGRWADRRTVAEQGPRSRTDRRRRRAW